MPRISDIDIIEKREQPTIYIRTITKVEELPMLIGKSYGKLVEYLKNNDSMISDMPYVAYYNMDMQNLDVEIGFPISNTLPGEGDIKSGHIKNGKYVFCMYLGSYMEMEPVYNEMFQWIEKNNYKPSGLVYEHYYNGPDYPEEHLLTMISMVVE